MPVAPGHERLACFPLDMPATFSGVAMFTREIATEAGVAAAKLAPPAAVVTASASGYTLQDWVGIATLIYLALQAAYLAWKWWRESRIPRRVA